MQPPRPIPAAGSIFLDARGGGRALRVTWHAESDLVVLSLWRENVCAGSFRLPADEVPGPGRAAPVRSGRGGTVREHARVLAGHPRLTRRASFRLPRACGCSSPGFRPPQRPQGAADGEPGCLRSARRPDRVLSWTRSATPTPPVPANDRRSWPAGTVRSQQFEVSLERVAAGRPDRSMVLSGLRGVGKTVLLNALRSPGRAAGLGDRPDRGAARPEHPDPGGAGGARRGARGGAPASRARPGRAR